MLLDQSPHQSGNCYFQSKLAAIHMLILPGVKNRKPVGSSDPVLCVWGEMGPVRAALQLHAGLGCRAVSPFPAAPFWADMNCRGEDTARKQVLE